MPKYQLLPKTDDKTWTWHRHPSGEWAYSAATMQTKALIDGGHQDCELRLTTKDLEALLALPQVQKIAREVMKCG